jgi:hypothetical protein
MIAPYLVLAAVITAIGVAGLWCNGSFQWHHAGHHTAAALARAEDERTVLWLRDLHRVPIDLHLVPPLRWAWIRLAALRSVLAAARTGRPYGGIVPGPPLPALRTESDQALCLCGKDPDVPGPPVTSEAGCPAHGYPPLPPLPPAKPVRPAPPLGQAEHLQRHWADDTGSFAAVSREMAP